MDDHPDEVFLRELAPGEQLLWSGRPPRGLRFRAEDVWLIPIFSIWTTLAGMGLVSKLPSDDVPTDFVGLSFMSLLVAIGIFCLVGRFGLDAYMRRCTCYGITSERVVVVTAWFGRVTVQSLMLNMVQDLRLTAYRDGGGQIAFGRAPSMMPAGVARMNANPVGMMLLELATDVRVVYDLIRNSQRST